MEMTDIIAAPEFLPTPVPLSKWMQEYHALHQMVPTLPANYAGKYVAVHEGKIVDSGDDQVTVALRAYSRHGYVPIYVGLVSPPTRPILRIRSPRLVRTTAG